MRNVISELRDKLTEYRYHVYTTKDESSIHINSIEIALGLAEYGLDKAREIRPDEEGWYNAGYYLDILLANSEWSGLCNLYYDLATQVKQRNFFREQKGSQP